MARIALISDVHGNRHALEAVLDDLRATPVDRVVCLGDIVGYGPDPGPCLDLVHEACDLIVLGNHDEAVLVDAVAERLNLRARASIDYAKSQLSDWHLSLLKLMPYRCISDDVSFAHAGFGPDRFEYLYDGDAAARCFEAMHTEMGCVGHTHIPSAFTCCVHPEAGPTEIRTFPLAIASGESTMRYKLPTDRRMVLNPGSVGQPRDRDPRAAWAVLDTETPALELRRVEYDTEAVAARIVEAGLPRFHGDRLRMGT